MQTKHKNTFTTIHTEGAILPPDLLQKVLVNDSNLPGFTPEAYHLGKNEKLNEAINRSWNRLLGVWSGFISAIDKLPSDDKAITITRERWLLILFSELGYGRLSPAKGLEIEGKSYPVSHMWCNTPIHLTGCRIELDRRTTGVAGAARMSPHSMVQEFLNRSKDNLWGFLSNGFILRILRDNVSLTRQAYVEFDLQAMMNGSIYSDFALLWLICHQSRVESDKPENCYLEKWSRMSHEQGTRALEQLRKGVEDAITSLGRGFILYRGNTSLKEKLKDGTLSGQNYYREILRLVYRLLFLFVAEDRDILLIPGYSHSAKEIYKRYYSTEKLRKLAGKRKGTKHIDLYRGLKLIMNKLNYEGYPPLSLPALGSYLWSEGAIENLRQCDISNSDFLDAIRHLSYTVDKNTRRPVDYKNLGSEELGSVYESLLELHPVINTQTGEFCLQTAGGSERKTTGSYYTPSSLINCLLDSALDPVLQEAAKKPDPESAILNLKICDPACGSGHFLIAAAHRVARKLASVRTGDDEPAPEAVKSALRDVIGKCIYGVDLNEMAVELCKVNLWMEALEPGKPLSFLDHHIKCGNSLVGIDTMERLKDGIPDDAFKPVTGDDKTVASRIKALNKRQRKELKSGQMLMMFDEGDNLKESFGHIAGEMKHVNELKEDSTVDVKKKEEFYGKIRSGPEWWNSWTAANIWTGAFFYQLKDENDPAIPTHERLMKFMEKPGAVDGRLVGNANAMAVRNNFFHWPLEFPVVYESGGFDVVLGNPPWDQIQPEELKFFAVISPEIAGLLGERRKRAIKDLDEINPELAKLWKDYQRNIECTAKLIRESGRFALTAVGKLNTYPLFAELSRNIINNRGRVGIIIPTGIATDDSCKLFFGDLNKNKALVSLYDFVNSEAIFPGVHRSYKFCLFTVSGKPVKETEFSFFLTNTQQFLDELRQFTLSSDEIELMNPNTRTTPIFRTKIDAAITKNIYKKLPILINERNKDNYWGISLKQGLFNMTSDSHLFFTDPDKDKVPLYESKMIWQFDHRFGTYEGVKENSTNTHLPIPTNEQYSNTKFIVQSRYWLNNIEVEKNLGKYTKKWLLGFRDITNVTNERTAIFTILPRIAVGHTMPLIFIDNVISAIVTTCLLANLNSIVFDYTARQKIGGTHLTYSYLKQLPVLPPSSYKESDISFISPRVLELVYTACDLKPFAEDMGYHGEPFIWNEERRAILRAELDAYYARLYGLTRDELRYILDPSDVYGPDFPGETFRVLKEKEIKKYGEYRTRRLVLEAWDRMEKSGWDINITSLDPPPTDSRVAHIV